MNSYSLQDLKDDVSRAAHGMTAKEAIDKSICVKCKQPAEPKCPTTVDRDEYRISGMCGECFEAIWAACQGEEEEEDKES